MKKADEKLLPPFLALQFLTRIPLPFLDKISPEVVKEAMPKAPLWFAFVGGLIGIFTFVVYFCLAQFLPKPVALIAALAAEILLSGAFHEDAVADFCDGFGGGNSPQQVHEIMKDSRIGTYGVCGLFFGLSARLMATLSIAPEHLFAALLFSESLSRTLPLIIMKLLPQAQFSVKISKDIESEISGFDIAQSLFFSFPFWIYGALVLGFKIGLLLALLAGFVFWFKGFAGRKLGGRNGDCLGFSVYTAKLLCLMMFCLK